MSMKIVSPAGVIQGTQIGAGTNVYNSSSILQSQYATVYARDVTELEIGSTASLTSLWSFNLVANDLQEKAIWVHLRGWYANATGGSKTLRIQINLGGTAVFDDVTGGIGNSANVRAWTLDFMIAKLGATSTACSGNGRFTLSAPTNATNGVGDLNNNDLINCTFRSPSTSGNITVDELVDVEIQHSVSDVDLHITRDMAIALLL